mgnify:CR=1 FL=1
MNIGDLVRYAGRAESLNGKDIQTEVGIVIDIWDNSVVTVRWSNGVESNHSTGWVIRIKEGA